MRAHHLYSVLYIYIYYVGFSKFVYIVYIYMYIFVFIYGTNFFILPCHLRSNMFRYR